MYLKKINYSNKFTLLAYMKKRLHKVTSIIARISLLICGSWLVK